MQAIVFLPATASIGLRDGIRRKCQFRRIGDKSIVTLDKPARLTIVTDCETSAATP